jgi:hypothetical protein
LPGEGKSGVREKKHKKEFDCVDLLQSVTVYFFLSVANYHFPQNNAQNIRERVTWLRFSIAAPMSSHGSVLVDLQLFL